MGYNRNSEVSLQVFKKSKTILKLSLIFKKLSFVKTVTERKSKSVTLDWR